MTNTKADANVIIGKIGTSFGVHGWLKVHTYTEFGPGILEYQPWFIQRPNGKTELLDIEDSKCQGEQVLIKVKNFDSPEAARLLTNLLIVVPREQLAVLEKNEYYWSDLIGLTVIDQAGVTLGKVTHLMETGSNDVLVIKGDKEYAIPYLFGSVVLSVDLEKKEIHVNWELI